MLFVFLALFTVSTIGLIAQSNRGGEMPRFTNLTHEMLDEILTEPKDHSNLFIGIAVGVMILACSLIYMAGVLMESVI